MIFLALALFFLFVFLYSFVLYPLVLYVFPRKPVSRSAPMENRLKLALIFCAYNEGKSLPAKLANIRELKKHMPSLEVLAYSDCSTDRTVELLQSEGGLIEVLVGSERAGKAAGMASLVAATDADIIISTDANVIIDPEAPSRILGYFQDPQIGTVAGTLSYTNPGDSSTAEVGSLFWRLEEWIKRLESETGSTMGADGSIYATRRALYPKFPPNLLDDLIPSIFPLFCGYRVVSAADVRAYEMATTNARDEFRRKRRIACSAFSTHRYLAPQLRGMSRFNRFKYFSHKYLRWFSALWMFLFLFFTLAAVTSYFGEGVAAQLLVAGLAIFAVAYLTRVPILSSLAEIVVSVVAVGVGVVESFVGREYRIWTPAESRH